MSIWQLVAIAALVSSGANRPEPTLVELARSLPHLENGVYASEQTLRIDRAAQPLALTKLRGLLRSSEPRIRATAAVALHLRLGPASLPDLASLGEDLGIAPPLRIPFAVPGGGGQETPSPAFGTTSQTVADVACSIVNTYTKRVGLHFAPNSQVFEAYWATRAQRTHCLSWFEVEIDRLARGTIPTPEESIESILALRQRIDALPDNYRDWLLLALGAGLHSQASVPGVDALISKDEVVTVFKRIPYPLLIGFLQGRLPKIRDPDFKLYPKGALQYEKLATFILKHLATVVPRKRSPTGGRSFIPAQTAKKLLLMRDLHAKGESLGPVPHWPSALWTVAAADLVANGAVTILHRAWKENKATNALSELQRQTLLIEALWRHGQFRELEFILNWFFSTEKVANIHGTGPEEVAQLCAQPSFRPLLRAILLDQRLESLDHSTFRQLVAAANAAAPNPEARPIKDLWKLYRWGEPQSAEHFKALRTFALTL